MTQCYITEDAYLGKGRNTRYLRTAIYKMSDAFPITVFCEDQWNNCSR